jgi:hypothetical protein
MASIREAQERKKNRNSRGQSYAKENLRARRKN